MRGLTPIVSFYNYNYSHAVQNYIGKPYVLGQDGPNSYDCSGTVIAGIRDSANPEFQDYTADELYNKYINHLSSPGGPGTLIFYDNNEVPGSTHIDHVATYVGNGKITDANPVQGDVHLNPSSYESNYTAKNGGTVYYGQLNWGEIMHF